MNILAPGLPGGTAAVFRDRVRLSRWRLFPRWIFTAIGPTTFTALYLAMRRPNTSSRAYTGQKDQIEIGNLSPLRTHVPAAPWNTEESIREELFSIERLVAELDGKALPDGRT